MKGFAESSPYVEASGATREGVAPTTHEPAASPEVRPLTAPAHAPVRPAATGAHAAGAHAANAQAVRSRRAAQEAARAAARDAQEAQAATAPPTIEVTIGRIEVRAVTPPAPAPPPARARREPPRMSLDEYLRGHDGGRP
ncbi:MAG TPA: hypothetical protein VF668_02395 [Pyrinomonadaceae bacterium]